MTEYVFFHLWHSKISPVIVDIMFCCRTVHNALLSF